MAGGPDQEQGGAGAVWVNLGAWALTLALMVGVASLGSWLILRSGSQILVLAESMGEELVVQAADADPCENELNARAEASDASSEGSGRAQGPVIEDPTWAVRPTPNYPAAAANAGVSGRVILLCLASPDGRVGGCEVELENPEGYGLAYASKASLCNARVALPPIDGPPVNRQIRIPFTWILE